MLTSLLLLALSSDLIDFNTPSTIEKRSAFFLSQANEGGARVKVLKPSAKSAQEQACRKALTLPQQHIIKSRLAEKLALDIPDNINFIDAEIHDYQQYKTEEWLNCTGAVKVESIADNEAFLALKFAWFLSQSSKSQQLRKVVSIPLNNEKTKADTVVLIASISPSEKGLIYLENHLAPEKIQLEESKVAVAEMWSKAGRLEASLSVLSGCESLQCSRIRFHVLEVIERQESEQADDLSSYF